MHKNQFKIIGLITLALAFIQCKNTEQKDVNIWAEADNIVQNIERTSFPNELYNITNYGAIPDGKTLNTEAINNAIKTCSKSGGGIVLVPAGEFLTGAIHLENNVNLQVAEGATLIFSTNTADYLPLVKSSWEGVYCYNYSPLIYAYKKENIALTGKGKIHGMSTPENWWYMKGKEAYGWKEGMPSQYDAPGRPTLMQYNKNQTPIKDRTFGDGHYLRPHMVQFMDCNKVLIEDITIEDSPFWVLHPVLSENVVVHGVTINSNGPNNDGCDPESCRNVLIENCLFNTGDDCIALKSGRDQDGRALNKPIENVVIRNCVMKNGHGGVVLGSEISGGSKNIFVEDCKMSSPELDRAIRIKTNNNRGGVIEKFYVRNIEVGEVKEAVMRINCAYDSKEGQGNFNPMVKEVYIENVHAEKAKYGLLLQGLDDTITVQNIHITNCRFDGVEEGNKISQVDGLYLKDFYMNNELIQN